MKQFIDLTNPLSARERMQIVRLINHDAGEYLLELGSCIGKGSEHLDNKSQRRLEAIVKHVSDVQGTVSTLVRRNEISLSQNISWSLSNPNERKNFLINLKYLFPGHIPISEEGYVNANPGKLQYGELSFHNEFLSFECILHSVIFNLVKNGLRAQQLRKNPAKNAKVIMNVRQTNRFPKKALFVPDGSSEYRNFDVFEVYNPGSFTAKRDFVECLTKTPSPNTDHGFGLYFVGLASRVLRAPVFMESRKDYTQISFYHPVYSLKK